MIVIATYKTVNEDGFTVYSDTYTKVDTIEQARELYENHIGKDECYTASIAGVIDSTDYIPSLVNSKIDFKQLKKQKEILINMIQDWGEADDIPQQEDAKYAEGLLSLIDGIQDEAVEFGWTTEEEAFNTTEDE